MKKIKGLPAPQYHKQYREKNKETITKQNKEYYKEYREKNKEAINKQNKEYREKNKETIRKYKKEYFQQKNILIKKRQQFLKEIPPEKLLQQVGYYKKQEK